MSLYTTPLQIGYFFSLLMWILFMVRGFKEQRLSDKLLGWIMFILAMELQDYTFGFAGINILWNELNGFPRGVSLLFGPVVYFYFRAQVDRSFRLRRVHLWHFFPYAFSFFYQLGAFVQGPEAVEAQQSSQLFTILSISERFIRIASFVYYLSQCMIIYKRYRQWSYQQFSNPDLISFTWFRNFIYSMIFWLVFREVMNVMDAWLQLAFYQDWWWNLALAATALYIGLAGYEQKQPAKIDFNLSQIKISNSDSSIHTSTSLEVTEESEKSSIAARIQELMKNERLYLQADLNLQELAQHLQINAVQLSATINQVFNKNFNDYINGLRIEEFIRLYKADVNQKYTLLSIALDSGFNSKATFNRAFKKIKGSSPKEFLGENKET